MPQKFKVTLTRDQMVLLRQMAAASTSAHLQKCVMDYGQSTDPDEEIRILEYIHQQTGMQGVVHRTLWQFVQDMVEKGGISATLEVSKPVLDWLQNVSQLKQLDPGAPTMLEKTSKMGAAKRDEYANMVYGLRGTLKAAVETEPPDAKEAATPSFNLFHLLKDKDYQA